MQRELDPLETLRTFVKRYPTQRAAASALGIHEVYLCALLAERCGFSDRMLERLGLRYAIVKAS